MPSSQVDTGTKSFTAGEDLAIFRLVKLTSGTVKYADAGQDSIGVTQNSADSGDQVSVKLWNSAGTFKVQSAGTIVTETAVYVANDGKVDDAVSGSIIGVSIETGTTTGDYVEFVKAEPTDIHVKSATVSDPAAMASITGAANAGVTAISTTYAGGGSASGTPADLANGTTYATDFSALEDNLASLFVGFNANRTDIALVLAQADKSTVDIAALKTAVDANNTAIDALIDALQATGLMA